MIEYKTLLIIILSVLLLKSYFWKYKVQRDINNLGKSFISFGKNEVDSLKKENEDIRKENESMRGERKSLRGQCEKSYFEKIMYE